MIQKKLKICDGCNEPKKIWKNRDGKRYCYYCAMKTEELTSNKTKKPTTQYRIPARSPKREKLEALYKIQRISFLNRRPICEMKIPGLCTINATTIQHLKGRVGDLYLDEAFWMPACWPCHQYADTHPEEALANGWALERLKKEENDQ